MSDVSFYPMRLVKRFLIWHIGDFGNCVSGSIMLGYSKVYLISWVE